MGHPDIRAGDAEREQALERLRAASVAGQLTVEELADRAERAGHARTRRELDGLLADLGPAPAPGPAGYAEPERHSAVLSSLERSGRWPLAQRTRYRAVFGSVRLDLRQAVLAAPDVELEIRTVCGSAQIIVPEGAEVVLTGGGVMCSRTVRLPPAPTAAGAPRVRIHVRGAFGSLDVRAQARLGERLKAEALRLAERLAGPPPPPPPPRP